jgi:hypothetical protein
MKFLMQIFFQLPVIAFLLGPNVLFSQILSLFSSLGVRDQVSHSCKTVSKVVVLYNLMFCS